MNGKSVHVDWVSCPFCIASILRISIFAIILMTSLLGFGQEKPPISIKLVAPISTPQGQREISLDRYHRIHVVLTNVSATTQRIWKDWNTWGYFNLMLTWKSGDRITPIRRNTPKAWDGDFPDFWTMAPGESVVLEVDMSTGEWSGFPDLYGEEIPASLQAIYENKGDVLASEFNIWVGKLVTPAIPVVFK